MSPTPVWFLDLHTVARHHNLDPWLIRAQVKVESGNQPWAWNPEPRYRYMWDVIHHKPFRALIDAELTAEVPPTDFLALFGDRDQEWWAQQASWGLMQVMGAVARELGFSGPYLTALCDPLTSLELGCTKMERLLAWADGDTERALAAYNGGMGGNSVKPYRNAGYAAKVFAEKARIA